MLLLAIFALVIVVHGVGDELNIFVFAAGVLFVRVHGNAFSKDLLLRRSVAV